MNRDPTALKDWVVRYLARVLQVDERDIDLTRKLGEFGLDSVDAMIMAGELEEHFGSEIDPTVVFQYDTLEELLNAWGSSGPPE